MMNEFPYRVIIYSLVVFPLILSIFHYVSGNDDTAMFSLPVTVIIYLLHKAYADSDGIYYYKSSNPPKGYITWDTWCDDCHGFTSHTVDKYKPGFGHLRCTRCGHERLNENLRYTAERDEDRDRSKRR